jgi:hypothetical protein
MPENANEPPVRFPEPVNPLDLPPLSMTDEEWAAWCEFLDIDRD